MFSNSKLLFIALFALSCSSVKKANTGPNYHEEPHRPQVHFTPPAKWMNDPNGLVYDQGIYHLFYQHYPDSTIWGPMHWGHATSKDLVHWEHQPIALYPDSLGYIFSGSAVIDEKNTSGFGSNGNPPMVAIFTHHDPTGSKAGRDDYENQSIAYSRDNGKTWTKYNGNPVVKNPGIRDFRDPKVRWHNETGKWIMTLATSDRVTFYSSPDLKTWTKESDFGQDAGTHGGAWECPDLFPLEYDGKTVWVLLVSIGTRGPNGGSATQYFTGEFDGHRFTPQHTDTKWIDYGPDKYAGVTWPNTGQRRIFLGWMSNLQYAQIVPTKNWRSAMTFPRELGLRKIGETYRVTSMPVSEIEKLCGETVVLRNIYVTKFNLTEKTGIHQGPSRIVLTADKAADFTISFSNDLGEKVVAGYDKARNEYFIDRRASGDTSFRKGFGARHAVPRMSTAPGLNLTLLLDNSSAELFADDGLSVMTQIFFPTRLLSQIDLEAKGSLPVKTLTYTQLKSMYKPR